MSYSDELKAQIELIDELLTELRSKFVAQQIGQAEGAPRDWQTLTGLQYRLKAKSLEEYRDKLEAKLRFIAVLYAQSRKEAKAKKAAKAEKKGSWNSLGSNPELAVKLKQQGFTVRVIESGRSKDVQILQ